MASSFTITQPFLGAPLQFQPALGSQELDSLIDFYVPGTASKQDKLSNVTIDFYLNATVDINTGALTKTYDVFPSEWATSSFEQSPTQSQSSGFSPAIYTPSPGSSATFGQDSGYGSITMTPPTKTRGGRVAKKAKKEVKKVDETRLPGFSILTKDGVDVTSTAGRGTKTKEQREHAHLMRIMKACDECKRKKVRCDPSHRRSHNDMSRSSTSTSKSSSSNLNPSPTSSLPSLSRQNTQGSTPASFSPSNGIDDFILFPEGSDIWNPADLALETQDISQFNFDINTLDYTNYSPMNVSPQSFDYSFYQQPSSFQSNSQSPFTQQLSDQLDWVDSLDVRPSQSSTQSSSRANNSGQLFQVEQQDFLTIPHNRPLPSSSSQDSGQQDSSFLGAELVQPFAGGSNVVQQSPRATLSLTTDSSQFVQESRRRGLTSHSPTFSWSPLDTASSDVLLQGLDDTTVPTSTLTRNARSSRKRSAPHDEVQQQVLSSLQTRASPVLATNSGDSLILVDPSDPYGGQLDGHTTSSSHVNECGCGTAGNSREQRPQGLFFPTVRSSRLDQSYSPGVQHSETENIPDYAREPITQLIQSSQANVSSSGSLSSQNRRQQVSLLTNDSILSGLAVNANSQQQIQTSDVSASELVYSLPRQQQTLSLSASFSFAILAFASIFAAPALQHMSILQTIGVSWLEAQHPFVAATSMIFCAALVAQIPQFISFAWHSDIGKWAAFAILGYLIGDDGHQRDEIDCHNGTGITAVGDEFLDLFEELRSVTVMGIS